MMKAIKNFMNKPITWGDSFKWSGTFLGLYFCHEVIHGKLCKNKKRQQWRVNQNLADENANDI